MARGIWRGTIGFGLVTIGVELYSAEAPERLDLDLLDKRDMSRIGYLKINKTTGKPVEQKDIVRGYEISSNRYVVLSDADLKSANPKATQTLDVIGFVPEDAIPRIYYAKPYFAGPTKGSEKAYLLFRDTLDEMRQVAIAQVVIRTRQYVAAIYSFEGALVAHLLRYDEELHKPADLGITPPKGLTRAVRPTELAMARKLVQGMAVDWSPGDYHDEYRNDVLKMAQQRAKGAKPAHEAPENRKETKVIDLMEALRRSVREQGGSPTRKGGAHSKRTRRSA
jgi:DNA end-binding protein Ku